VEGAAEPALPPPVALVAAAAAEPPDSGISDRHRRCGLGTGRRFACSLEESGHLREARLSATGRSRRTGICWSTCVAGAASTGGEPAGAGAGGRDALAISWSRISFESCGIASVSSTSSGAGRGGGGGADGRGAIGGGAGTCASSSSSAALMSASDISIVPGRFGFGASAACIFFFCASM